jgi:putative transposase
VPDFDVRPALSTPTTWKMFLPMSTPNTAAWPVNVKLVNRLYREMILQLRNKSRKRKVKANLREGREAPSARNDVWAMDLVHDQLFDATKLRVLTIVDAFTKFFPAIVPRLSWRGEGVVEVLERVRARPLWTRFLRSVIAR